MQSDRCRRVQFYEADQYARRLYGFHGLQSLVGALHVCTLRCAGLTERGRPPAGDERDLPDHVDISHLWCQGKTYRMNGI